MGLSWSKQETESRATPHHASGVTDNTADQVKRHALLQEIALRMRGSIAGDEDMETWETLPAPPIRLRLSRDEFDLLQLDALTSTVQSATDSPIVRRRLFQKTYSRSSDLDVLFGKDWYFDHSGRVMIVICPPIRISVEEIEVITRTNRYDFDSGTFTPLKFVKSDKYVDLSIRFRYCTVFSDKASHMENANAMANEEYAERQQQLVSDRKRRRKAGGKQEPDDDSEE